MKRLMAGFAALLLASTLAIVDAQAARLSGGRSMGMQRAPITQPLRPSATPQAPNAAPTQQAARPMTPAPAQPKPSGWGRWGGALAGLAAGIGLAALLSHFGLSGDFAGFLLLLVLAFVGFMLIRRLFARPQPPAREPMQYAGAGGGYGANAGPVDTLTPAGATGGGAPAGGSVPAGFDADSFLRSAKVNFIRLQAAHDAGNLDDIREFTAPEMFAELKLDIDARAGRQEKTDVVALEAELLDVTQEASRYIASVRFHGLIRESAGAAPAAFDEVWHLTKPADGGHGWVLAGVEQIQ